MINASNDAVATIVQHHGFLAKLVIDERSTSYDNKMISAISKSHGHSIKNICITITGELRSSFYTKEFAKIFKRLDNLKRLEIDLGSTECLTDKYIHNLINHLARFSKSLFHFKFKVWYDVRKCNAAEYLIEKSRILFLNCKNIDIITIENANEDLKFERN